MPKIFVTRGETKALLCKSKVILKSLPSSLEESLKSSTLNFKSSRLFFLKQHCNLYFSLNHKPSALVKMCILIPNETSRLQLNFKNVDSYELAPAFCTLKYNYIQ